MGELTITDPCLLFAHRRESLYFRRQFRPKVRFPGAPCPAWFASQPWLSVLMLETGVGPEAVGRSLRWALSAPKLGQVIYRPRVVLSVGFSGALQADLHAGDLVLANEIVDRKGELRPASFPSRLPNDFAVKLQRGRLLTMPSLIGDPQQKQKLGEEHRAMAVDMETAEVARLCLLKRVPFGCLRAILDDWQTPLSPQLTRVVRGGRVGLLRMLLALTCRPALLKEFWWLAGHSRRVARRLAEGLMELLTLTLSWMD